MVSEHGLGHFPGHRFDLGLSIVAYTAKLEVSKPVRVKSATS